MGSLPPETFINDTLGALQIGALLSYMLFGMTTTQVYLYHTRFPEDARWIRLLVAVIWLLEATQACLLGYVVYFYTITDYGDSRHALQNTLPPLLVTFILNGAITTLVESFFIYRIYQLSEKRFPSIIMLITSIGYFLGSITFCVAGFHTDTWARAEAKWGWDVLSTAILGVTTDLSISVSLVVLLIRSRGRGIASTTAVMDRVIAWTIETCSLTTICMVLILIFYETRKQSCKNPAISFPTSSYNHTVIWLALVILKSRLFSNSLLASLNSRTAFRGMLNATIPASVPQFSHIGPGSRTMENADVEMFRVQVETKTHVHHDDDEDGSTGKLRGLDSI
ncbi:hypothetical protein MIND_01390700 [Mycena indigotica]|uniref:DUF6534 domain-containing protein n=1 Tax=Mycena indigotica TaxID=2126181 RepID=A0A8H6VRH2_9AGAR|nr:uncharacterized protein MIND_01390700 [Mycena indigotica]KAF7289291.1 hypothetical protein MIND_01390700 [Mycena indigotica]